MRSAETTVGQCPRVRMDASSEELELNFDDLAYGSGPSIGAARRREPPAANRFHCLFVESEAETLGDVHVRHLAVGGHNRNQLDHALNLHLHGFVAVIGARAIQARRHSIAARSRAGHSAAGSVLLAGTQAVAIAVSDAIAAALPYGITAGRLAQRIAP